MADVSYADVIRTVNGLLKTKYPEITRYGNDTVDKAVPPYFFVECVPVGAEHVTKNMLHKGCSVLIHLYAENSGPDGQSGESRRNRGASRHDDPDRQKGASCAPIWS